MKKISCIITIIPGAQRRNSVDRLQEPQAFIPDDCMYYSISESKIAAVNHLGKAEKIYDTGTYSLHHDYVFDDDGNLLVLATDTESDSVEDQIIQINTQTGEVSCVLDLGELFSDYKEECTENEDGELIGYI